MKDSDWQEIYSGKPLHRVGTETHPIDLLKDLDLRKNTLRNGWRFDRSVLTPTAWDDDHGPWLQIPVAAKEGYLLHVKFTLTRDVDALYLHVPIASASGMVWLHNDQQGFDNVVGVGELKGDRLIPLGKIADATFIVAIPDVRTATFTLTVNSQEALSWKGSLDKIISPTDVWNTNDESYFRRRIKDRNSVFDGADSTATREVVAMPPTCLNAENVSIG